MGFEDSVWEILYGKVGIWVDLDERLKKSRHCGDDDDVCCGEVKDSTEKETVEFEGESVVYIMNLIEQY